MQIYELIVRAILALVLLLTVLTVGNTLQSANATTPVIILGSFGTAIVGISFSALLGMMQKKLGLYCVALGALLLLIALTLHNHLIPFCGDDICSSGECLRGCRADCTPAACIDAVCQPRIENCQTSVDCACFSATVCAPARVYNGSGANSNGCVPVICGDGYCDVGETQQHCCQDCGCEHGFSCTNNICIYEPLRFSLEFFALTNNISVTSLAGNPKLTNETGVSHPLLGITLQSPGYEKDITVTFSIPNLISNTVFVGSLKPGEKAPVVWFLESDKRLLTIIEELKTNVTISVQWNDPENRPHTSNYAIPITLQGRNTLDKWGHLVIFVTQDIITNATTPEEIWDELRRNFTITNYTSKVRFPIETYLKHSGSPRDIALLLASAYDAAGWRSTIVEGPAGLSSNPQVLYVHVRIGKQFIMLDPALFHRRFDDAITAQPGFGFYEVRNIRTVRNFTALSLDKRYIAGADMYIHTNIEQQCMCEPSCVTTVVASHVIANNGLVPVRMCANSRIVDQYNSTDIHRACFYMQAQETMTFPHSWKKDSCVRVSADVDIVVQESN